ncbi:MAG: hypothetical protein ABR903_01860 [Thermodesulfovibrionales bacterium]
MYTGVLKKLGRSRYLHLNESGRDETERTSSRPGMVHTGVHRNETPVMQEWYREAKETESSGRRWEVLVPSYVPIESRETIPGGACE